ncbi:MAG: fibronectin type III domain-containing protein [bacterium]|jgi:hypothetical protein|nr:fibronectin type III domain-containing protein [bacterium]
MKLQRIALVVLIIMAGIFVYATISGPSVDSTNRVHTQLYEGADDTWDAQAATELFREQMIDGETIGSSTALGLRWSAPKVEFNHYVVTISHLETGIVRSEASEQDRQRLDLTGLDADTNYTFALQACIDRACDEWIIASTEATGTTPEEYWVPMDEDKPQAGMNLQNP